MSRLKKTEKYAIQWLDSQGFSPKDIANEINLPEDSIIACLEKYKKINENNNVKTGSSSAGTVRNKNLMITQTSGKKNKGVAIMTPEASMVSDASKKNQSINNKSHRDKSAIYNPIKK